MACLVCSGKGRRVGAVATPSLHSFHLGCLGANRCDFGTSRNGAFLEQALLKQPFLNGALLSGSLLNGALLNPAIPNGTPPTPPLNSLGREGCAFRSDPVATCTACNSVGDGFAPLPSQIPPPKVYEKPPSSNFIFASWIFGCLEARRQLACEFRSTNCIMPSHFGKTNTQLVCSSMQNRFSTW